MSLALSELYACGIPAIPPIAIEWVRWGWMAGTIGITVAWGANQWRLDRAGQGNRVKPLLFASSFAFWWYANLPIESAIVGVVLFVGVRGAEAQLAGTSASQLGKPAAPPSSALATLPAGGRGTSCGATKLIL